MAFLTGAVVPLTQFQFRRTNVVGQDDFVVLPDPVYATTDTDGILTVDLFAGQYVAEYSRPNVGRISFAVGVPDTATANLDDLIDQNPPVTPSVLALAQAASASAIAARDIAQTAAASVGYAIIVVEDDAVGSIVPPEDGGFVMITAFIGAATRRFPSNDHSAFIWADTGPSLMIRDLSPTGIADEVSVGTGDVTGTTGVDGETTIVARPDLIKIENRFGDTLQYKVSFR